MDSAFFVSLLTVCSLFRLQFQLPFDCINLLEKEKEEEKKGQRILSRSSFGFKANLVLFLLFKFDICSVISRVVVVLFTIVTPLAVPLMILRRLSYTTGNRFTYSYYLLVARKDLYFRCA
jgi:hypothetical protein